MKINILGQEYDLLMLDETEFPKLKSMEADGLAELYNKQLIINKECTIPSDNSYDKLEGYVDKVIRHEIIHAYFHEAGLMGYCKDEQLVDWLAMQLPKMMKTINEVKEKDQELYKV